jgi:hypothetical protein
MALESGHVVKPSNGWYSRVDTTTGEIEDKKFRVKDTDTKEFWLPIITGSTFPKWVKETYQVSNGAIMNNDSIEQELAAIELDD